MVAQHATKDQPHTAGRSHTRTTTALVAYLRCDQCGARFYGQPLLRYPACPSCQLGRLQQLGSWNLATQPWWPLLHQEKE